MQNLITLLIISLFLFSCQSDSGETDELSKNQERFVKMTLGTKDVLDAKWESPGVLILTVKQDSQEGQVKLKTKDENGNDVYVDSAQFTAASTASLGKSIIGLPICVRVVYPDGQEVIYKCAD